MGEVLKNKDDYINEQKCIKNHSRCPVFKIDRQRERDRQTERERDRQTERDREIERDRDRETETERDREKE